MDKPYRLRRMLISAIVIMGALTFPPARSPAQPALQQSPAQLVPDSIKDEGHRAARTPGEIALEEHALLRPDTTEALLVFPSPQAASTRPLIEALGGRILVGLDDRAVWCLLPRALSPAVFDGSGALLITPESPVDVVQRIDDPTVAALAGEFLRATRPEGRQAYGMDDPLHPLINDAWDGGGGPRDGDTSDMTGPSTVAIIFVESNGAIDADQYTWTTAAEDNILAQISSGLAWWAARAAEHGCSASFPNIVAYRHTDPAVQQGYEPILHPSGSASSWISAIMGNLGFTSGDASTRVSNFNTWLRTTYNTDRSYTVFIAYNPPPAPDAFTDGYAAWAYFGGPYTQLLYRSFGWSFDRVFTHETGHIYYACDEYYQAGYGGCTSCGTCSDGVANGNCEYCNPSAVDCMMRANSWTLCSYTPGHLGWDDCILLNDSCSYAGQVYDGGLYDGFTVEMTQDGAATCGTSSSTADVWYKYLALGNGTLVANTCAAASYDCVLSVHTGCPGTTGNQIGCNDDSPTCGTGSTRSHLSVSVTIGTTYYIRVAGYDGATGTFTLVVSGPADATPPTPNPMTFETPPTPNGMYPTTAIDMVATMASDPSTLVQYAFYANTGPSYPGADSRDWGVGRTYTDEDLTPNTSYVYRVKARDGATAHNETSPSADASAVTHIQTPTGLSFGATTTNSVVLNATGTFTNLTAGSSGVWFDSTTAGGDGGINAWVQTTTDTATGLTANTLYTFQTKARNQSAVETPYSDTASKWTLALVPTAPTLGSPTSTTMTLNVNPNGNPAATTFAIRCTAANPADANWVGKYVDAAGAATASAVWQTDAAWGTITVNGLQPNRTYTFAVKARNGEGVETVFGPGASLATQALTGGACCDPTTGDCTIATQSACTSGGGAYQGNFTTCTPNPCAQPCLLLGDVNVDGWVDGLDIAGFVRAKLGQAPLPGENPVCADYGGDLNLDIADFVADLIG